MYSSIWKNFYSSVCSLSFYGSSNSNLLGISGFRSSNLILTDDVVYHVREAKKVVIRFYEEDGLSTSKKLEFPYTDFLKRLPPLETCDGAGFSVIPFTDDELSGIPSLQLCQSCSTEIGREAIIIGFQFDYSNLSLKPAIVSAFYRNGKGLSFIQYNGVVKEGMSGAPLIGMEKGGVLGIVMNKELTSAKKYHELMRNIGQNIDAIKAAEGKLHFDNIDPMQVLLAHQHQIKHLTREQFKNSGGMLGFALEISHVNEFLNSGQELDYDQRITAD